MTENRTQRSRSRHKSPAPVAEFVVETVADHVPYDEALLECARTQWQFGDWASLAQLDLDAIQHHPQRAKLALLAAAGRFQHGDQNEAHRFIRLAQDWGCSRKLIAQMLISGTHNALGAATAILDRQERAREHFCNAVKLGGVPGDANLLTEVRASWQGTNSRKYK